MNLNLGEFFGTIVMQILMTWTYLE